MEQRLSLADEVKSLKASNTAEQQKLESALLKELSICFTDLQSLVQICVQRSQGQEPNLSELLGVRGIHTLIIMFAFKLL